MRGLEKVTKEEEFREQQIKALISMQSIINSVL